MYKYVVKYIEGRYCIIVFGVYVFVFVFDINNLNFLWIRKFMLFFWYGRIIK